jgi:hypothetical protein
MHILPPPKLSFFFFFSLFPDVSILFPSFIHLKLIFHLFPFQEDKQPVNFPRFFMRELVLWYNYAYVCRKSTSMPEWQHWQDMLYPLDYKMVTSLET